MSVAKARADAAPSPASDASDELVALERRGWEALSGPDGARFYGEVMADDGLMLFPAMALDKEQTVQAIASAAPWSAFDLSDLRVIELGHEAIVTYRAVAHREGEAQYQAWMSSVYAFRDGAWRLVLHQQTPDPA